MPEPVEKPKRAGVPASAVASVRLPSAMYDELYAFARASGREVSQVIRDAIESQLVLERRAADR